MTTLSRPPGDPSAQHPGAGEKFRNWLLLGLQDAKGERMALRRLMVKKSSQGPTRTSGKPKSWPA